MRIVLLPLTLLLALGVTACQTTSSSTTRQDDLKPAPLVLHDGIINFSMDGTNASLDLKNRVRLKKIPQQSFCKDSIHTSYIKDRFLNLKSTKNKVRAKKSRRWQRIVKRRLRHEARHVARSQLSPPAFAIGVSGVPVEYNVKVEKWLNHYTGPGRRSFLTWLVRAESMKKLIIPVLKENGLPAELTNLAMIESGFNTHAYSRARATGTWQFMKATAKDYDLKVDYWVDERRDPVKSTVAAARYLIDLYKSFGDWYLAFAAYNAGPGKVRRALRKSKSSTYWEIAKTRYLRRETKEYVPKILAAYLISENPEQFGFRINGNPSYDFPTHSVEVQRPTRLADIAHALELDLALVKKMNPELRRSITPPQKKGRAYTLRLPASKTHLFASVEQKLPHLKIKDVKMHKIQRGDTLSRIARLYGVTQKMIRRMNNNIKARRLRIGKKIAIPVASVEVVR